ncbi:uncharacterized protein [Arachis hypogaea]|uniref:uncharacterized protein n=1 Tax=Arachis hypogaea TaxID=3818 RepID=UPI003B218DED
MTDALFDVYQNVGSPKELWDKLEAKYMAENTTSKKFLVTRFNNYKMVDGRSVMEQLHEIERILNNFKQHNMHMDDIIIVSSIVDKLPPSWKEFKRTMKHRKDDISREQLSNHLHLEEEYRKQDDTKEQNTHPNLHVMEDGKSNQPNKKRYQDFNKSQGNNGDIRKNKKKGNYFHCRKLGHFKKECHFLKTKKEKNDIAIKDNLIAVISEINMIEDIGSWWIDSGATRHVCKNRNFFKTFKEENRAILYMKNASTVQVMGKRTVKLEFTSGRVPTLTDVYYVPEIRKI